MPRSRQNVIALAFVIIIALCATLLFSSFMHSAAMMKCVTSGRQDCDAHFEMRSSCCELGFHPTPRSAPFAATFVVISLPTIASIILWVLVA